MNGMERERSPQPRFERPDQSFRNDVINGLSAKAKFLPPKYFYDQKGSQLFDLICGTEEYYPTRTESGILARYAGEMLTSIAGPLSLIELGSGSSIKTRYLLEASDAIKNYLPIDISTQHLLDSTATLAAMFPRVSMHPLAADYTELEELPQGPGLQIGTPLVFFPGSTIGNLDPSQRLSLLRRLHKLIRGQGYLLLGIDLIKDRTVLDAAYNDHEGHTAAFNLNLLERINRELRGSFDLNAFEHLAFYNSDLRRIEMHLRSLRKQTVTIDGLAFAFEAGETIHTESSYKFDLEDFGQFAQRAGWVSKAAWTDPAGYFGVMLLKAQPATHLL